MSFIWTVGVEALVRPQLQPTPPAAPPASPSPHDKTQRRHTTQKTLQTAETEQTEDGRQKTKDDLCGDRETCLARVTAAACVAFHIICLSYGPLATLHSPRPLSALPFSVPRTYLFMPHVKSEQRAKFSFVLLVIRSAKRRSRLLHSSFTFSASSLDRTFAAWAHSGISTLILDCFVYLCLTLWAICVAFHPNWFCPGTPSQKLTNRESPTIVEPEMRIINLSFNKLFACDKMRKIRTKEVCLDLYPAIIQYMYMYMLYYYYYFIIGYVSRSHRSIYSSYEFKDFTCGPHLYSFKKVLLYIIY